MTSSEDISQIIELVNKIQNLQVIYQTRETVFHRDQIQTYDAQPSIFDEIRGVWIADETLSRAFDISSQSKQKLRSKRRSKIVKISAN